MNNLDWSIVGVYIAALIWLSYRIGKSQSNEEDYYLGSKNVHWLPVGISTMATQLSTNSMLGAPAFVAFSLGGGLLWLQYELAVPLSMIFIMIFLVPFYKRAGVISVYEFLGLRFGVATQTIMSILFQLARAFATGVTVYGVSLVLQVCLDIPIWLAVVLLGVVTIIYDTLGGIRSVILSDVLQMAILLAGVVVSGYYAVKFSGGLDSVFENFSHARFKALDFSGHGLGDGAVFSFLPMLVGGFFLYVAYYGCDQTQVQRQLSTKHVDDAKMALFLNGMLRFPIVILYCFLGVAIGAYAAVNPEFISSLPTREVLTDGIAQTLPNYNTSLPMLVLQRLPHGVIGLIMVALFAAAMSSLDSTLNSLSASTVRDIIDRFFKGRRPRSEREEILLSKGVTVFWGVVCVTFSFFVGNISDSIIVSINKIGSLANGSILATFLLAILTKRATDSGTVIGIVAGFLVNLILWLFVPQVSWLWWNVTGCAVTFAVGYGASLFFKPAVEKRIEHLVWRPNKSHTFDHKRNWKIYYGILTLYFLLMILLLSTF